MLHYEGIARDIDKVLALAHPDFGPSRRSQVRGSGGAIYKLLWQRRYGAAFVKWTHDQSSRRRWLPSAGAEWRCVQAATNFTQAYHIFRVLANGIRGDAGRRSPAMRRDRPRRCTGCGDGNVAWS